MANTNNLESLPVEDRLRRLEAIHKGSSTFIEMAMLGFIVAFIGVRISSVFSTRAPRRIAVDVHHHHDRPTE